MRGIPVGSFRKSSIFSILLAVCCIMPAVLCAVSPGTELKHLTPDDFKRLQADSWRAVGKNIIIEGNAYLPVGSLEIYADRIVVNMESRDFEASGNIRICRWQNGSGTVTLDELAQMERSANVLVRQVTSSVSVLGERTYHVSYAHQSDRISADKVTGNLDTSYFELINPTVRYATFVCKAEYAIHGSDGVTTMKNAQLSSCSFLESDNAHYSIAASEVKLTPYENRFYELKHANFKPGDCSVLLYNGMVKVYGVPVLWLPIFFKPKDENPGISGFQYGRDSDLGVYINLYRRFVLADAPYSAVKLHLDWYEKRGFGYGADAQVIAEDSRTDVFVYSIYDRKPYKTDDYFKFRQDVPHNRYDFRISNITHITPRTDFRGVFDFQSDPYFKRDFFREFYEQDPQPATFAALEQQFDRFSMSLYTRFQINNFYTTVEKLPEIRMDIPRQEIFDTGIYYQGELQAAYMKMNWIEFDQASPRGFDALKDYEAFRFDMTHFLYYPIANDYFSFVPRAGFRLTSYSKTSDSRVNDDDLKKMFAAAEPQNLGRYNFNSYDKNGGSKVRLAFEVGFELSTKFHNAWQDVHSGFFELDGLRHIVQPYINYTFIPKPTLNRNRIYFFDDVDRISKQNFFRLGLVNRLQTRSGNSIRDVLYMENYWDIHMERADGQSAFGNVGTMLSWKIFKGLSLNSQFLIDVSGDGEIADTYRHGRNAGKTGIAQEWLNLFDINLTYKPLADWEFVFGYNYVRPYEMRSTYSMGSTLTQINSASYFQQYNDETDEGFYLRMSLPLTPDRRTFGAFNFNYDVQGGTIDEVGFAVIRNFHCWQLVATLGLDREYEGGDWDWDVEYSVSANLTGLTDDLNNVQNSVLREMDTLVSNIKF